MLAGRRRLAAAWPPLLSPTTASTPSQHVREEKKATEWPPGGRQRQAWWCFGRTSAAKSRRRSLPMPASGPPPPSSPADRAEPDRAARPAAVPPRQPAPLLQPAQRHSRTSHCTPAAQVSAFRLRQAGHCRRHRRHHPCMHCQTQQNITKKNQCSQALFCRRSSTAARSTVGGILAGGGAPIPPRPAAAMPSGVAVLPCCRQLPALTSLVTANRPPTEPQQADTRPHRHHSGAGRPATIPGAENRFHRRCCRPRPKKKPLGAEVAKATKCRLF